MLTADNLILFAEVAAAGSFTAAGRRHGLPKSTVSRRIAALESALGQRLLTRGTRSLSLTPFGDGILRHGQRLLEELTQVTDLAQHRQLTPVGPLRVSLPPEFQELSLLPLLQDYVARYPMVRLELDLSPHRVDLLSGRYDLAVRIARQLPDDSALVARPLAELRHGLYASPAYLARHGAPAGPQDLTSHVALTLIGSDGQPQGWQLTQGDTTVALQPQGPVAANSISLNSGLAVAGVGIAGMSERFAAPFVQQCVLPQWQLPTATVWAVTQGRRLLPLQTRAFIDRLREVLAAQPAAG
ncbi:LysR family transcriptional regulator [Aquabacterium sp. OR-4]|uniref:LysR family transcriptional regulator n=1 Tax=Aquabacterium sp. OR-4 TaxID=2978127 RepID=UPI0028C660CD|nr:LysR family transcriptional regulator [Aquabacterium sp. OR-4]MDT7838577.1 LysR family transcriptional regulator [Aquabacterium sp. OR-4]